MALLLYADDIVLIADSRKELNRGLEIAGNFGYNWRCKYNAKKTQVVIFGKGKKEKFKWKIGTHVIQQVDSYKYLGIEMENKLTWKLFKRRLIEKAEKNMCAACAMGMRTGHLSVKVSIGIWKTLVRPILEFAAEVWGEKNWEEAEKLQRKM